MHGIIQLILLTAITTTLFGYGLAHTSPMHRFQRAQAAGTVLLVPFPRVGKRSVKSSIKDEDNERARSSDNMDLQKRLYYARVGKRFMYARPNHAFRPRRNNRDEKIYPNMQVKNLPFSIAISPFLVRHTVMMLFLCGRMICIADERQRSTSMTNENNAQTTFSLAGVEDRLSKDDEKFATGLRAAGDGIRLAIELYESFDKRVDWSLEAEKDGDQVFAKFINGQKYYGTTSELPMHVDALFHEVWTGVPLLSTWNTNIAFSKVVKTLTPNADILHYGTADVWVVKGRDFVVGRIFRKIQSSYVMAARSFELASIPDLREKVRGHLILAAARYAPHPTNNDATVVDYIMCTDFKGALPAFVINQLLARLILKDAELSKNYIQKLVRERQKTDAPISSIQ